MLSAIYKLEIIKNGNIRKVISDKSHSFLKGFVCLLHRHFASQSTCTVDIDNASRCNGGSDYQLSISAPGGKSVMNRFGNFVPGYKIGIVVGTGTNSVSPTDYKLQSQVEHGTGTGQFIYYGSLCSDISISGSEASFKTMRLFENKSGGSITINEIGIYAVGCGGYSHCIVRDVLGTGVTVNDNEVLKVEYTIKITV